MSNLSGIKYTMAAVIRQPQASGYNLYTDGDDKVVVDSNGTTFTGARTSGSAVVTGISSTSTLRAGMFVKGTGFAAGTYILSVDSSTQVTMSNNAASGTGTSTTFTIQYEVLRYPSAGVIAKKNLGAPVAETQQVTDVSWTAGSSTTYSFLITQVVTNLADNPDPLIVSYTSDTSGTSAEIAAGLAAELNAFIAQGKLRVSVVEVSASNKITITADAGYPVFTVTSAVNCTPNTTTPGVFSFGTGADLLVKFLPPDNTPQVQRPYGFPYANTNYPIVGNTYYQAYITVQVPIGSDGQQIRYQTITYYYMIDAADGDAAACAAELTA